jgi:hypothetical protein
METKRINRLTRGALVLSCLLAAGCTSFSPQSLSLGTSVADARRSLGPPTGQYALPDAGTRLEYARGPFGKQTWMLDFDSKGGLASTIQVLTEARFNQVLAGMSKNDLLMNLGRPSEQSLLAFQRQTVWSYRYEGPFCQWFQVGIDERGQVADTGYYPDPHCETKDDGRDM